MSLPEPIALTDVAPVFRYFPKHEWATAFARGEVRLSTLARCRACEDPLRGDPREGEWTYRVGHWNGNGTDPEIVRRARLLGFNIGPDTTMHIQNPLLIQRIKDAWVICCTSERTAQHERTYGKYCVRIDSPFSVYYQIAKTIANHLRTRILGGAGTVVYHGRDLEGVDIPRIAPGFIKDPRYSSDSEARMIFYPHDPRIGIEPMDIRVPAVIPYCQLV